MNLFSNDLYKVIFSDNTSDRFTKLYHFINIKLEIIPLEKVDSIFNPQKKTKDYMMVRF